MAEWKLIIALTAVLEPCHMHDAVHRNSNAIGAGVVAGEAETVSMTGLKGSMPIARNIVHGCRQVYHGASICTGLI
jgi:hypothetical protein